VCRSTQQIPPGYYLGALVAASSDDGRRRPLGHVATADMLDELSRRRLTGAERSRLARFLEQMP
jgi:hypothetical protein